MDIPVFPSLTSYMLTSLVFELGEYSVYFSNWIGYFYEVLILNQ